MRASRDFDILERNGWKFSVTITGSEKTRREFEPNAESIHNRIGAIERARCRGIKTWVSIEPVIRPMEAVVIMGMLKGKADEFKIGKINYFKNIEDGVDWKSFVMAAEQVLHGENYMIKEGTLRAAGIIK